MKSALRLEDFRKHEAALKAFEETSILDIKALWCKSEDIKYDDDYLQQKDLPYKWEDPLYMKMIHRFRNCDCRISQFYHQIDPCNQQKLLTNRLIRVFMHDRNLAKEMISFLAWTSNMLGTFDVREAFKIVSPDGSKAEQDTMIHQWKSRPIAFFLTLPDEVSRWWLQRYNREEVQAYNDYLASKAGNLDENFKVFKQRLQDLSDSGKISSRDEKLLLNMSSKVLDFPVNNLPTDESLSVEVPWRYKTTAKGLSHFKLLGEREAETAVGKLFRKKMTRDDWHMQQLLVLLEDELLSRDNILWNLGIALIDGRPQLHIEMVPLVDQILATALQDELIAIAADISP